MLPPWLEQYRRAALLLTAFLFPAGYATDGLVLLLLAVIAEGVVKRRLQWQRSPCDWPLVAFLAVFLVSSLLSPYRVIAVGATGLAALTIYLGFGPLYRATRHDSGFVGPIMWALFLGGLVAAGWAIVLHRITGRPAFLPELGQNAVGTTLLIAVLVGLGLSFSGPIWRRALMAPALAVIAYGLLVTYTRGAWVGAAAGLLTLLILAGTRHIWSGVMLVVLVAAIGFTAVRPEQAALARRAASIVSPSANIDRIYLARSASAIFVDHPLLGTGMHTFPSVYPQYRLPEDPNPLPIPFAHNIFANMAAEGGILGLGAFVWILIQAAVSGWRGLKAAVTPERRLAIATILATFVGMMVHQVFDGTLLSVHLGTGMWFAIAILAAGAATSLPKQPPQWN